MPRLQTSYLRHARALNPLLPLLLQTCRTIPSAHSELRWLRSHVAERLTSKFGSAKDVPSRLKHRCVASLARKRARGVPLQYLLGSQPFGDLSIKCEKGVLIPRQCTEAYVDALAKLVTIQVRADRGPFRIRLLDFCTGSGCIPLGLLAYFSTSLFWDYIDVTCVDISPQALALAEKNYRHNRDAFSEDGQHKISFLKGDVLDPTCVIPPLDDNDLPRREDVDVTTTYTIITCNPPYISARDFATETERSVRNYEPKLALVPPPLPSSASTSPDSQDEFPEDVFYHAILARPEAAHANMLLFEVSGTAQALRIAKLGLSSPQQTRSTRHWTRCEIWGDEPCGVPSGVSDFTAAEAQEVEELGVGTRGRGVGRSVVFMRWPKKRRVGVVEERREVVKEEELGEEEEEEEDCEQIVPRTRRE